MAFKIFIATLAALATTALANNGPVAFRESYGDGTYQRYRVDCSAYQGNYCQDFVHALGTADCGEVEHNWQAYELDGSFVFDVSVVRGVAGAANIACAINKVTGQGAYGDSTDCTACDNYPGANYCVFNGISSCEP